MGILTLNLPMVFDQDLEEDDLLFAFNNNIVEFYSANMDGVFDSVKCDITFIELQSNLPSYVITPDKDNIFWYNFKDAFVKILNQNDFADDFTLEIVALDPDSCILEDNDFAFRTLNVNFKITFADGTTEENSRILNVLKGVEQQRHFNAKRRLNKATNTFFILTPFDDVSDRKVSTTWWEGYPFDIGFYKETAGNLSIGIGETLQSFSFPAGTGRIIIDDGSGEDITNWVPITEGINSIAINSTSPFEIELTKIVGACGHYLKWINKYGKWDYYLFNQRSKTELQTKSRKQIFNDFDGLGINQSPYLSGGKDSKEVITLNSGQISAEQMLKLQGLIESPKVYLYESGDLSFSGPTGSGDYEWLEVELKSGKTIIENYKGTQFKIRTVIELPPRNTMIL